MASPWRAMVIVAGVTAATAGQPRSAVGQPIVSPSEVAEPAAKPKPKPAPKPAKPKPAKPATAKTAKATKPAARKSAQSAKPAKPARSAKASKPAKAGKPAARSGARVAAVRGGRGDNMPRGFAWPATPAMQAAGKACEADLGALNVTWKRSTPEGRIADPIEVPDGMLGGIKYTSVWRSPPHKLDCQLARALAQVGPDLYALGVREVRWGSIYRWSNVRTQGTELPFLSRHALGLAMDVVELIDDTGRVANVQHAYLSGDVLLTGVEQIVNSSGKFRLLLTPRNDPKSHDDHFHIEANPDYTAPAQAAAPAAPAPAP